MTPKYGQDAITRFLSLELERYIDPALTIIQLLCMELRSSFDFV